ncbi:PREDICTED: probable protein phosphatase 2C 33 [Ipomoea nil]|uniref:probable protein phosphatase 2C 33 n=1 Tax=Ipomoea nil TaxID=35883 RepID=UPI000900A2F5|nr:PREDICTED: probable protein phosphatase 2C 33 [Ipomoea nil]XP_019160794.1 PREDICTED: probable protein phosphatase 2C 33 [Ipomoea nil]XP_019160795.1 PREDICTED: probable protein phosphatase 2C 33 [Ipomoea nil]XP_019160796.1 PREDICTED: probable protein phosphatase 2C 33 [Ipomoea nil]
MGSCFSSESRSPHPGSPMSAIGIQKKKSFKRRAASRNSSFDYRREEHLHRIPGRRFLNGSSEVAALFSQQGKKGTNQDAMIVWENFGSRTDTVFCGVFDGHGPHGHMVAKRVRDSLPLKLSAHWEVNTKSEDVLREINLNSLDSLNSLDVSVITAVEEPSASTDVEEVQKHPDALKESFLNAFKVMDRELRSVTNIDCFCSGTTAVTLVKQGRELVIGNVGDSRAVLGTRDKDDYITAVQLTVDLKPNLPVEAERIRKCKGRVFALRDEPGVARVWLPNTDSPGLAMARAFGDFCLKDFGLISVPEVSYRRLTDKDEFIVLATDGIWDVLSNEEVVKVVASSTRSSAAKALVETAVRGWKTKYANSKVDDCAVVCLFLNSKSNDMSSASRAVATEKEADRHEQGELSDESREEVLEQEDLNEEVGKEWSALEGVSRVNTLVTLPRFVPEKEDKKAIGGTKMKKQ